LQASCDASFARAWQSISPPISACQAAGQVAGSDIGERTLGLKGDSGHFSDFHYDRSTTPEPATPPSSPMKLRLLERLNIDDRVCVEAFRTDNKEIASRVRSRTVPRATPATSGNWSAGRVKRSLAKTLDVATYRITVRVSASSDVSVAFWILPTAANDPSDTSRGCESLALGDAIYVWGIRT